MTAFFMRTARFALLLVVGFVLGMAALTYVTAIGGKNSLFSKLFGAKSGPPIADASCDVPSKDASRDVYFVSCGGFF